MAAQDATTAPSTDETVSAPIEIEKEIKYRDKADRPVYKLSVKLIDTYKHINKVGLRSFAFEFCFPSSKEIGSGIL